MLSGSKYSTHPNQWFKLSTRWVTAVWVVVLSGLLPNNLFARATKPVDGDDLIYRSVTSNVANTVAFIKDDGIYVSGQRRVRRRVQLGDEAPGTGGGLFERFTSVALNSFIETLPIDTGEDDSTLGFRATLSGGRHTEGIFALSQNRLMPIALTGNTAPNTGGGTFKGFADRLAISNRIISIGPPRLEVIVFRATVEGGKAEEGIFAFGRSVGAAEQIVSVAVQENLANGTGGGKFSSFGDFTVSDSGLVAYVANIEGGGVDQGIYFNLPFLLGVANVFIDLQLPAALAGQPAAGLRSAKYERFDSPVLVVDGTSLNVVNELAFHATLTGGDATSPQSGLFQIAYLGPIPISNALALQGQPASQSGAGKYASFTQIAGNNQQQLAFYAPVDEGSFPGAIFLVTLGPLTLTSKTVELGSVAPDTDGGRFEAFCNVSLSDNGRVVFSAKLSGGNAPEGIFFSFAKRISRVPSEP